MPWRFVDEPLGATADDWMWAIRRGKILRRLKRVEGVGVEPRRRPRSESGRARSTLWAA